jgi:hypothetical protein
MQKTQAKIRKIVAAVWTHRAVYICLAGAYGLLCLGADKIFINQCITAFYAMLAMQRR